VQSLNATDSAKQHFLAVGSIQTYIYQAQLTLRHPLAVIIDTLNPKKHIISPAWTDANLD